MPTNCVHTDRRRRSAALWPAAFAALSLGACAGTTSASTAPALGATASVGPATAAGPWRPLVAAHTLEGWRGYRTDAVPAGWTVTDGTVGRHVATGDLVTRDEYGDFELEWEWKVGPGGDAGVFYRGTEAYDRIYWSAVEYQLQDDAAPPDGPSRLAGAGAVYGLYPARAGVVHPAGEWNRSRIVARGAHVEHWLNGEKLAEYDAGSADWEARVGGSKFARWPAYGRARRGHIAIQGDHAGDLAIRGLRLRELR